MGRLDLEFENSDISVRRIEEYRVFLLKDIVSFFLGFWVIFEIYCGRGIFVFRLYGVIVIFSVDTLM